MKKEIKKLVVAGIMVLFTTIAFSAIKNINLVKNGDFINWSSYKITNMEITPKLPAGKIPTGWMVDQSAYEQAKTPHFKIEGLIAPDTEITHNSKISLKIENGLKTDITESVQYINNIKPYTSYKISCWIKGKNIQLNLNDGAGAIVWFNWGPGKNFWSHQHYTARVPKKFKGSFRWNKFSFIVDTGANAGAATIALQLRRAKGTVWYDDVKVVPIGKIVPVKSF
jgi:uncharacterized membrane protein (GlpM family)